MLKSGPATCLSCAEDLSQYWSLREGKARRGMVDKHVAPVELPSEDFHSSHIQTDRGKITQHNTIIDTCASQKVEKAANVILSNSDEIKFNWKIQECVENFHFS